MSTKQGAKRSLLLASLATALLLFLVVGLWTLFVFDMRRSEKIRAEISAELSGMRLRDFVQMRLLSIAAVWTPDSDQNLPDPKDFRHKAENIIKHLPGLLAINWIDAQGFIRIVYPQEPNRAALGRDLKKHPSAKETFLRAMQTGQEQFSPPINLYQGGTGLAAYIPVKDKQGTILGFINAVFRLKPLIRMGLGPQLLKHFHVHILFAGRKIFDSQEPSPASEGNLIWVHQVTLAQNVTLQIQLSPLSEGQKLHLNLWLLLAGAVGISLLLGVLLWRFLENRRQLHNNGVFYSQLVATMNEGLFVVDKQGLIHLANPRMKELLQQNKDLKGQNIHDFFFEPSGAEHFDFSNSDKLHGPAKLINWKNAQDEIVPSLVSCSSLGTSHSSQTLCVVIDISERIKAEKQAKSVQNQLIQSQKMEAIGRLAAGVAHDFNNILAAIRGFAELLEEDIVKGTASAEDVREILRASEQAESLTQKILHLSREQHGRVSRVHVDERLNSVAKMLQRLVGKNVHLNSTPNAEGAWINIDSNNIENMVTNLVINARDAIKNGGCIDIISQIVDIGPEEMHNSQLKAGPHVCIVVSDNGTGIPASVLPHVLEPFYTTKPEGQGTGLGLSTVYGMVRSAGGDMKIKSLLGQGTSISLYFPLAPKEGDINPFKEKINTNPGNKELILVVEDEDMVRKMVVRIMQKANYQVLEARDGLEAFEIFKKNASNIDLVLSDVVMNDISGPSLYKKISQQQNNSAAPLPFLLMTGHAPEKAFEDFKPGEKRPPIIHKPFNSDELLTQIDRLLKRAPGRK